MQFIRALSSWCKTQQLLAIDWLISTQFNEVNQQESTTMYTFIKWLLVIIATLIVWITLNYLATVQAWFTQPLTDSRDPQAFLDSAIDILDQEAKGNGVLILLQDGEVAGQYQYSKGKQVDGDTVFGVASISKWVAAVGVMALVEQGKLDLDAPVSKYLTRWQLPPSEFDHNQVTIARLLSHTAGITDGLGHNGFQFKGQVQPLVSHLTKAQDADEGVSGKVEVGVMPGSTFKYSGGSYNLLQLVVEEVSGQSFATYMQQNVFSPLGMQDTGYDKDQYGERLAEYFDKDGKIRNYPYYTSLAATGLYTSANDLLRFAQMHLAPAVAKKPHFSVLSQSSLATMRSPHASSGGLDIWGLGVMLFAENNQGDFIIGHGGQSPALNATVRVNPDNGNGIIMLTTGNVALASDTATQWTLWETGNPDMYMLRNTVPQMFDRVAIGAVVILTLAIVMFFWRRQLKRGR